MVCKRTNRTRLHHPIDDVKPRSAERVLVLFFQPMAIRQKRKGLIMNTLEQNSEHVVRKEVIFCASHLVQELLSNPNSQLEDELNHVCYYHSTSPDDEYREVFEHWIVSEWLATQLEKRGESVAEICNAWIWGRTTTGQAISSDSVIEDIATELFSE